mmetsp:Transcript_49930/g.99096  ORF Transcript_49930/g.99096 Transcript_49930/m.99096 type:complete len:273 (+) Transcript_49930:41-859(+)
MEEPTKPMTVMTATERQLTRHIIEERDERIRAVGDLWAKLRDLQRELQKLAQTGPTSRPVSTNAKPDGPEMEALRSELSKQQRQQDSHRAHVESMLTALRAAMQKTEIEVHEGRTSLGMLMGRLESLRESQGRPGEGRSDDRPAASLGSSTASSDLKASSGDTALAKLQGKLKEMEQKQHQHFKELAALRAVLIEVHVNLPLHAVRASRIALRSTELSKEERKLALSSLEAKEQQIRADIDKVREKNDRNQDVGSVSLSLNDIRSAVAVGPE